MNTDLPKLPHAPQYVIERSFNVSSGHAGAANNLPNVPAHDAENWGGQFIFTSGTAASGTSLSTVRTYDISFIPAEGVIPSYEIQLHQMARNFEQITNPTKKLG